ncbi:MAG TPA: PD-(D/E)XK nuclease family protein [Dehalococcoidia bacterium]|nr:PD-(D/E)XK nuclease family protein [Dehalococcoidia bacterium]
MSTVEKATTRTKAHIRYKLKDGTGVPGVTTVLGVLNKPALVKWANNLGLQGIDSSKYVDDKAAIGTLAHLMVADYLRGQETDTSEYSKAQIDQAENSVLSFFVWEEQHAIEAILIEEPMVSEHFRFGGTIDCLAKLDGKLVLIDLKTSKGIYPEMLLQLAAYNQLLSEHGHVIDNARILRIGRDEDEGFEERQVNNMAKRWEVFSHCLAIYNLNRELKGGN